MSFRTTRSSGFLGKTRTALLAGIACMGFSACTTEGGQTGAEHFGCLPTSSSAIGLNAPTRLGFSPADVLAYASEALSVPFQYADDSETTLQLRVEVRGEAMLVDREWRNAVDGREPASVDYVGCHDVIEIPVTLHFATDDGRFDDAWPATLQAATAARANLWLRLQPDQFNGDLDLTAFAPSEFDKLLVDLELVLEATGASGAVIGGAERTQGDSVSFQRFDIGLFGDAPAAGGQAESSLDAACDEGIAHAEAGTACEFISRGLCFSSAELACACAGCPESCLIAESYPAQAMCRQLGDPSDNPDEPVSDSDQ